MALLINKVGSLVEVQFDGDSPDIVHQSGMHFDEVGTTGIRATKTIGKTKSQVFVWADVFISGVATSSYSDFKTKLATVFSNT